MSTYQKSTNSIDRSELLAEIESIAARIKLAQIQLNNTHIMSSEYDNISRDINNMRIKAMKLRIRLENLGDLGKFEVQIINKIPGII